MCYEPIGRGFTIPKPGLEYSTRDVIVGPAPRVELRGHVNRKAEDMIRFDPAESVCADLLFANDSGWNHVHLHTLLEYAKRIDKSY